MSLILGGLLFACIFLTALGLPCCPWTFSSSGKQELLSSCGVASPRVVLGCIHGVGSPLYFWHWDLLTSFLQDCFSNFEGLLSSFLSGLISICG